MFSGFKIVGLCLGAAALYLASGCQPDLASLDAAYDPSGAGTGAGATSGRAGATSSGAGTSSTNGGSSDSGGSGDTNAAGDDSGGSAGTTVTPPACSNKTKDSNESDVDCGGTSKCLRCAPGLRCTSNKDCDSAICKNGHCADPTCNDGVLNQDETDVDCGGSCNPCDDSLACAANADCTGDFCKDKVCTDHCTSGVRESDETDKDCGGATCAQCADNLRCNAGSDCVSKICNNNKCQPATCSDQVQNQDESDTDCGGVCSDQMLPCAISAKCNSAADCDSYVCTKNRCAPDLVIAPGDVIDDFEDGDLLLPIPALGDRAGSWYAFGDSGGNNNRENVADKRGSSLRVLHSTGVGFNDWGSGIGVDFNNPGGASQTDKPVYDASQYSGITFWARAGKAVSVSVPVSDIDTDSLAAGKTCTTCDHHWFKSVQVTTDWQRFTVLFAALTLEPGDIPTPTAFNAASVVSVQFREAALTSPTETYDLWIDDVAFVK